MPSELSTRRHVDAVATPQLLHCDSPSTFGELALRRLDVEPSALARFEAVVTPLLLLLSGGPRARMGGGLDGSAGSLRILGLLLDWREGGIWTGGGNAGKDWRSDEFMSDAGGHGNPAGGTGGALPVSLPIMSESVFCAFTKSAMSSFGLRIGKR